MGDPEKHAMNKYLKDLERSIVLSQSFLRTFVDKNILRMDDKTIILKQTKSYDQVKKFIFSIRNTPGAFRVLVDVLKKDRNTRYIAMNLEDAKKAREKHLAEQRKKKQERQIQKAQDTLMYEIGSRLALLVEGRKLRGLEAHPFEYHVTECSRLIDRLEESKKELEYEDAPREPLSLPQLVERKIKRSQKRTKEEQRRLNELQSKMKDLRQENEEKQEIVSTLEAALVKEKENMKLWQQRQNEDSRYYCERLVQKTREEMMKKHAREKMGLQDQLIREREKRDSEIRALREEYKQFKESCTCSTISTKDTAIQAGPSPMNSIQSDSETSDKHSPAEREYTSASQKDTTCRVVSNIYNHSVSLTEDGGGFMSRQRAESVYTREVSKISNQSNSSEVSNFHVQESRKGNTNLVINKVKNLHLYQN